MHRTAAAAGIGTALMLLTLATGHVEAQEPAPPGPRAIPGITADDPFPQACVSCHAVLPDGRDVRISTRLGVWIEGADSALVALAQSSAPAGMVLQGKHPTVAATDIPGGCLMCHSRTSTMAPPFARMLHRIHLTGGDQSIFLSMFQGECTYCHKLDLGTGAWSIPSGPEPEP